VKWEKGVVDSHGQMEAGTEAMETNRSLIRQVLSLDTRIFTLESIIWEIVGQFHIHPNKSQGNLCILAMHAVCTNLLQHLISTQQGAMDAETVSGPRGLFILYTKQTKRITCIILVEE
jgi:hypothetical protein